MLFDEKAINSALVRVITKEGGMQGTGFFILPDGTALTCHHLVESSNEVILKCADGTCRTGMVHRDDRYPEFDLAIVRCNYGDSPGVLPIEADRKGVDRFWTKGFHLQGTEITDALPATGTISGETNVQFSTLQQSYNLCGALVLKKDRFDAGISGAPVLDPHTGVAFAMVNAKFNGPGPLAGFALPFERFSTHSHNSDKLSALLEQNRKVIARYGRYLNYLGAVDICRRQTAAVIQCLVDNELFLGDRYCDRELERDLSKFLNSDAKVLPIVGNAGVGKTTLLAHLAETYERPVVFLLGRDVCVNEPNLSAVVRAQVEKVADKALGSDGSSSIVSALVEEKSELLILLDGFNEIPSSVLSGFSGWIQHSISWLKGSSIRLVLSMRSEFWQTWSSAFPDGLLYQVVNDLEQFAKEDTKNRRRRKKSFLELTDFSPEETKQAIDQYGLDFTRTQATIRHPLFLRLLWELQDEVGDEELFTSEVALERFVQRKCQRVAQSLAPTVSMAFVKNCVRLVAQRALKADSHAVSWGEFLEDVTLHVGERLIDEGLFVRSETRVRFAFDEVGEFVQGQTLDLLKLKACLSRQKESAITLPPAVIAYAMARLDREGNHDDVLETIQMLLAAHREDRDRLVIEAALTRLLPMLEKPARYFADLESLAQQMAVPGAELYQIDPFNLRQAIAMADLPVDIQLRFLLHFIPYETYYEFELKHWQQLKSLIRFDHYHTAASISSVITDDPKRAFEFLTLHIGDTTLIYNSLSVHVGEAISTLLFVHRELAFGYLCELLARSPLGNAETLLTMIARSKPLDILALCTEWVQGDDLLMHRRAVQIAFHIAGQFDESNEDAVFEVLKHFIDSKDSELKYLADIGIGRLKKHQSDLVGQLIMRMEAGEPAFSGFIVAEWPSKYFNEIVAAVARMLEDGQQPERCCEAIFSLSRRKGTLEQRDRVIDLLILGEEHGLMKSSTFGHAIEYALMDVDSAERKRRMYELAEKIAVTQEGRQPLQMFALNPYEHSSDAAKLQDEILDLLIEHEMDRDQLIVLLHRIASACMDRPEPLQFILRIANKLADPDLLHRHLIGAAWTNPEFGDHLLLWLRSDKRLLPYGETQRLIDRLDSGIDLNAAINEIVLRKNDSD